MVCSNGITAISRMVTIAGAASSSPSRASAFSSALRRALARHRPTTASGPVSRPVVVATSLFPLAGLEDLAHLVGHLLDRLIWSDLLGHGLPEGRLDGIRGDVRIERRHRAGLEVLEGRLRRLRVGVLLLDLGVVEDRRPGWEEAAVEEPQPLELKAGEDSHRLQRLLLLRRELGDAEVPVAEAPRPGLRTVLRGERSDIPLLLLD